MAVVVSDDLVRASGLTEDELRLELAAALYARDKATLGQAARLAGLSQSAMLDELARREIPMHYGVEDFEQDLVNLEKLFPR